MSSRAQAWTRSVRRNNSRRARPALYRVSLLSAALLIGSLVAGSPAPAATFPPLPPGATAVLSEGFETGAPGWGTSGFWHVQDHPEALSVLSPAINPTLVTLPDSGHLPAANSGTHAAWFGQQATGTYCGSDFNTIPQSPKDGCTSSKTQAGDLTSPSFNLSGASTAQVSFAAWWEIESVNADVFDVMDVQYTTDGGATWTSAGKLNPANNPAGAHDQSYSNEGLEKSPTWHPYVADISKAAGHPSVQIRFDFNTNDGLYNGFRGLLVDDVQVSTPFSAPAPALSSLTPGCVLSGSSSVVDVTGTNFVLNSQLTVDGSAAPTFVLSDTRIEFVANALGAGNHDIKVTEPNGAQSNDIFLGVSSTSPCTVPTVFTVNATFGTLFNGGVAKFASAISPGTSLSDYSATITWGDGSITPASLSTPSAGATELDVSGSHTYWSPGSLSVVVTLTNAQTGAVQIFNGNAVVSSRYIGMGDSYSSGEGAGWPTGQTFPNLPGCDWALYKDASGPLYQGSTDHINGAIPPSQLFTGCDTSGSPKPLTGNTCHRAITAYAHVVNSILASEGMALTMTACSGAVVNGAYLDGNAVYGDNEHTDDTPQSGSEPAQVNSLRPDVSLITLTMGGNNVGFPTIAKQCVTSDLFSLTADCVSQDNTLLGRLGYDTSPGKPGDGNFKPFKGTIVPVPDMVKLSDHLTTQPCAQTSCFPKTGDGNLHDALVLLYRDLKQLAPGARILVLGYPAFFPAGGYGSDCEHFSQFDQVWINDRIKLVDNIISDAANESGVAEYVDAYNALAGHEECTGTPVWFVDPVTHQVGPCTGAWINGINLIKGLERSPENLHPNPCAHQAEGELLAAAYNHPSVNYSFSVPNHGNHTTAINVPNGAQRLTISTSWLSGHLGWTLTDPFGHTYTPLQSGSVFQVWTQWGPPSGAWTLTTTNQTPEDTGIVKAAVSVSFGSIPTLPPAGVVVMNSETCVILFKDCTANLVGDVSHAITSKAQVNAEWFDQYGNFLGKGGAITVHGIAPFKVILKTTFAAGGAYRLTSYKVTCNVSGC